MTGWEHLIDLLARHPGASVGVETAGAMPTNPKLLYFRLNDPAGTVAAEGIRDLHPLELDRAAGDLAFKMARHLSDLASQPETPVNMEAAAPAVKKCRHVGTLILDDTDRPRDEWRWQCTRCGEWFFMAHVVALLAETAHE